MHRIRSAVRRNVRSRYTAIVNRWSWRTRQEKPARSRHTDQAFMEGMEPRVLLTGAIEGFTFIDANANADYSPLEASIAGVTIDLWRDVDDNGVLDVSVDVLVDDVTTDEVGAYGFANLTAGNYFVLATDDQDVVSQFTSTTGTQLAVTVLDDEVASDRNFGYQSPSTLPASISSGVFDDADGSSTQEPGELGIVGVSVDLYRDVNANGQLDDGDFIQSRMFTTFNGSVIFDDLDAGAYLMQVSDVTQQLDNMALTVGVNPLPVIVDSGEQVLANTFGYHLFDAAARLQLYIDQNDDGAFDSDDDDRPAANVSIDLYRDSNADGMLDELDSFVKSAISDTAGQVTFSNLPDGDYLAVVTDQGQVLAGHELVSDVIALTIDNQVTTSLISVGAVPIEGAFTGSIGDLVWHDLNGNGVRDIDEPGIEDMVAVLYSPGINGLAGDADDVQLQTSVTDTDGLYQFINLAARDYFVKFRVPANATFTNQNAGADDIDSDANIDGQAAVFSLAIDESIQHIDAGVTGVIDEFAGFSVDVQNTGLPLHIYDMTFDADGYMYVTGSAAGGVDLDPGPGVAGVTSSDGDAAFLARYTPTGALHWVAAIDATGFAGGDHITVSPDGRVYWSGSFAGAADIDPSVDIRAVDLDDNQGNFLMELTQAGHTVWTHFTFMNRGIGFEYHNARGGLELDAAGNLYISGVYGAGTLDFDPTNSDTSSTLLNAANTAPEGWVAKFSSEGGFLWAGLLGGSDSYVEPLGMTVSPSGDVFLVGTFARTADFDPGPDNHFLTADQSTGFLLQLSRDGAFEQVQLIGIPVSGGTRLVTDVAITPDGGLVIVGQFNGQADFDPDFEDELILDAGVGQANFVIKYDFFGNVQWGHAVPDNLLNGWSEVEVDVEGSVYLSGYFDAAGDFDDTLGEWLLTPTSEAQPYVVKFSDEGVLQDVRTILGAGPDAPEFARLPIALDPLGRVYLASVYTGDVELDSNQSLSSPGVYSGVIALFDDLGPDRSASVGDFVWQDVNQNGVQDDGEPGVAGALIELYSLTLNEFVSSTITDSLGHWRIESLLAGDYIARITPPTGFGIGDLNTGDDRHIDSDFNSLNGVTAAFSIDTGELRDDIDAGLISGIATPGAIGDQVFLDLNGNGIREPDEPGVAGVAVTLLRVPLDPMENNPGEVIDTMVTGASGFYRFDDVVPGRYALSVLLPNDYSFAATSIGQPFAVSTDDPKVGNTDPYLIGLGDTALFFDVGVTAELASLAGETWIDKDTDGVRSEEESSLGGVSVQLYRVGDDGIVGTFDDLFVAETTTDALGAYQFEDLPPIDYYVTMFFDEYAPTLQYIGSPSMDSDLNADGMSGVVTAPPGGDVTDIDGGFFPLFDRSAGVGDRIWQDLDANGIQDFGEPGLAGARVDLFDETGQLLGSMFSDEDGRYGFQSLEPGTYRLKVTLPEGFLLTAADLGEDDRDSDFDSMSGDVSFELLSEQIRDDIDAGAVFPLLNVGRGTDLGKKADIADAMGNIIRVKVSGQGHVQVVATADGFDIVSNNLGGGNIVITARQGLPTIRNIVIGQPNDAGDATDLGKLTAKGVDITGDVVITGAARKIQLADVAGANQIMVGGDANDKPLALAFDHVDELSVVSQTPIKTLKAESWLDRDDVEDVISAPEIRNVTIKGDFEVGFDTQTINRVRINGDWRDSLSQVAGDLGSQWAWRTLDVRGVMDGVWLAVDGSMRDLRANALIRSGVAIGLSSVPLDGLPNTDDFVTPYELKKVDLRGVDAGPTMTGSIIAAWKIGNAKLRKITGDALPGAPSPFGVAAHEISRLEFNDVKLRNLVHDMTEPGAGEGGIGDFEVRLV